VDEVPGRIEQSRNWFERAAARIPGYRGYKERELRREADKLQREYVAERLEAARRRLEELELALTRTGDLGLLGIVDTSSRRLRTVKDRWLTADYGYAGLFDTVKVDETMLDQLYAHDLAAQEQATGVEQLVGLLSADSPTLRQDIALLDSRVGALDEYFTQREHLVTGVGEQQ
jgi:hypothetical protein